MENLENNKLIAEFMGVHEIMHDGYSEYDFDDNTLDVVHQNHLQYHKSWDWLMPVVEEIDHLQFEEVVEIEEGLKTRSLSDTYKSVVEFIKQQNKNK